MMIFPEMKSGVHMDTRTDCDTICISQPLSPQILFVHITSDESVTLKCAKLRFDSANSHAVLQCLWLQLDPLMGFCLSFFYPALYAMLSSTSFC